MVPEKLLPTTTIGSYSLPKWLRNVMRDYKGGVITEEEKNEAADAGSALAIKDQEIAGIDIITSGEMHRPTMVEHFSLKMDGFQAEGSAQAVSDFEADLTRRLPVVVGKVTGGKLNLVREFSFLRNYTLRPVKFTVTGPHMLSRFATNRYYKTLEALAYDIADVLNSELKELVRAGLDWVQVDEPVFTRNPEDISWGIRAFNRTVDGVNAKIGLHICYGTLMGRRLWKGNYTAIFPGVLDAHADHLALEFARHGTDELALFKKYSAKMELGMGAINVTDNTVERPEVVADRIRQALKYFPPEKVYVNPDCGFKYMPREVAFKKMRALVEGAAIVRRELEGRA